MREYKLLISHVGADGGMALKCAEAFKNKALEDGVIVTPVYMESETDGCVGDFMEWSANAVERADGVLAVITESTAEKREKSGTAANVKVVYDEVAYARNNHKDIIVLRKNGVKLDAGFELLLQNMKCVFFDEEIPLRQIITEVVLHAKHRFGGKPLLEYAGGTAVRLITTNIPDTSEYIGRADKLREIEENFEQGKRVVCITGFGGIGKTTLAKMYAKAHSDEPVTIYYCSSEEASLKNAVISLGVEYDAPDYDKLTIDEKYALRVKQLKKLETKTLIIIDNFNADFGAVVNRDALTDLSTLDKCRFIISSRRRVSRNDVGLVDVGKLADGELMELFYRDSHCEKTKENDGSILQLIERTKGHTMTMELAAKAVGMDENGVTVREIVESFLTTDAVTVLEDRHDGYDEYETIYSHLRKLFDLTKIDETQKTLLGALSFVARRGLTVDELKANVEYSPKDLIRLCALGYITKSDDTPAHYSQHPLMSELAFMDFVKDPTEFEKIIEYILNTKTLMTENDTVAEIESKFEYAEHVYRRFVAICAIDDSRKHELIVACDRLGCIMQAKGNIAAAEEYYKQDYELAKQLVEEIGTVQARKDLFTSCRRLGDIAMQVGDITVAEEYYKQGYELVKQLVEETGTAQVRRDLSISYDCLGDIAKAKGEINAAEEYYKQSYEIKKALVEETGTVQVRRDLSVSYNKLGQIAKIKGDIPAAEEYYKQDYELAKAIAEETGTVESKRDLSISYYMLGDIAKSKGDIPAVEEYYSRGYELREAIVEETGTIEARRGLAISCGRLGDMAKTKGDIPAAEEYYKQNYELAKAIAEETGTIEARRDLSISCRRLGDMAKIKGDIPAAEEYYKQSYEIRKQLLEETGTIEAQDDLIVACYKLYALSDDESMLFKALESAEKLHIKGVDFNGRYEFLAPIVAEIQSCNFAKTDIKSTKAWNKWNEDK